MKADMTNLGKWIDELTAAIEDLEKRVDSINIDPPAPGNQIIIEDLGEEPIYAALYLPTGKALSDYQYFLVTVIMSDTGIYDTVAEGLIYNTYGEVEYQQSYFFGNSEYTFMMMTVPGAEQITLSQETSQPEQHLIYKLHGIKYIEPETVSNRLLLKRAADAVKKAVKRKTTKGGKKKDASK